MANKLLTLLLFISISLVSYANEQLSNPTLTKQLFELHGAIKKGDLDKVEELLKLGIDPNTILPPFNTIPLIHSPINNCKQLNSNHVAVLKMLLEAGANPDLTNDRNRETALINLGYCKNNTTEILEMADLLISYGADVKHLGNLGNTALTRAILGGNEELALMVAPLSNARDRDIQLAMNVKMSSLLKVLLDNGVPYKSHSLVLWSLMNEVDEVLIATLERGANPDSFLLKRLKNYTHPIILAASKSNANAVKILHQYGADMNVVSQKGLSIRDIAIKRNNQELIEWLDSQKQ